MHKTIIHNWGYQEGITTFLLTLNKGATVYGGGPSVSGQLLEYVRKRRPLIRWAPYIDRLGFAGFAIPVVRKYAILLNPKHIQPDERLFESTGTLAHELGHAIWNSHGFDSTEEEYYCDRVGGRAYREILIASGWAENEATDKAQQRYVALNMTLKDWTTRRWENTKRSPLKPWTWFDRRTGADIASQLVFGVFINLGLLGHPVWERNRKLGV